MDINFYSPKRKLSVHSLHTIAGLLQSDIYEVIAEAERIETMRRFKENIGFLCGKNILFLTDEVSGKNALSFQIAVSSVGASPIVMPAPSDDDAFVELLTVACRSDVAAVFVDKEGVFGYANKLPQSVPLFNLTSTDNPFAALSVTLVLKRRFGSLKNLKVAVKDRSNLVLALSKCEADLLFLADELNGIVENDVRYLSQFCRTNVGIIGEKSLKEVVKNPAAILSFDALPTDDLDEFAASVPDFAFFCPPIRSGKAFDVSIDCDLALTEIIRAVLSLVCR